MHISADNYVHIHTFIQQYARKQIPSSPYKHIRRGCNLVPIARKVPLLTRQKAAVVHSSLQIAHANLDLEECLVRSLFMYDSERFGVSCQFGALNGESMLPLCFYAHIKCIRSVHLCRYGRQWPGRLRGNVLYYTR